MFGATPVEKIKSFPSHSVSWQGGADLQSRSCSTMNTGPVCHTVCLFTPQLTPPVPYYTAWSATALDRLNEQEQNVH